jgi:hypothetical protein
MRPPSILDVLRAVKRVAAAHPEVASWWYAPPQRLRLTGELPLTSSEVTLEVVLDVPSDGAALDAIGGELSRAVGGFPVRARAHRGAAEERPLFRLVSSDAAAAE